MPSKDEKTALDSSDDERQEQPSAPATVKKTVKKTIKKPSQKKEASAPKESSPKKQTKKTRKGNPLTSFAKKTLLNLGDKYASKLTEKKKFTATIKMKPISKKTKDGNPRAENGWLRCGNAQAKFILQDA